MAILAYFAVFLVHFMAQLFGIVYWYLDYFDAIIVLFGIFFPVLVFCIKKSLAALLYSGIPKGEIFGSAPNQHFCEKTSTNARPLKTESFGSFQLTDYRSYDYSSYDYSVSDYS
jgi:hypothetical protein